MPVGGADLTVEHGAPAGRNVDGSRRRGPDVRRLPIGSDGVETCFYQVNGTPCPLSGITTIRISADFQGQLAEGSGDGESEGSGVTESVGVGDGSAAAVSEGVLVLSSGLGLSLGEEHGSGVGSAVLPVGVGSALGLGSALTVGSGVAGLPVLPGAVGSATGAALGGGVAATSPVESSPPSDLAVPSLDRFIGSSSASAREPVRTGVPPA